MAAAAPSEIERLRAFARQLWGTDAQAQRFWTGPHLLLRGRTPLEVASESEAGARRVEQILGRLKFGSAA
jgi:uncharacterized protein (DUF2384 family)